MPAYHNVHVGVRRQLSGVGFLLQHVFEGSDLGVQAWWQVSFLAPTPILALGVTNYVALKKPPSFFLPCLTAAEPIS